MLSRSLLLIPSLFFFVLLIIDRVNQSQITIVVDFERQNGSRFEIHDGELVVIEAVNRFLCVDAKDEDQSLSNH